MSSFDTDRVHAGYNAREHKNSVNLPIYATASFELPSPEGVEKIKYLEAPGCTYSRVANPTVFALEERLGALDGAEGYLTLSSGMAAVTYVVLALTNGGGNIIVSSSLYGGTVEVFANFYPKFGAEGKIVKDRFSPEAYEEAIDENTKAILVESISNPNAELYDIDKIAEIAHKHNIPLIVDNTIATPYLYKPFEHGADIIVYSATKGISGHGNSLAGVVLEKGEFSYDENKFPQLYEKLTKIRDRNEQPRSIIDVSPRTPLITYLRAYFLEYIGAELAPFDAYLIFQGLSTISERLSKQSENARQLAEFLNSRGEVTSVNYPTLKSSPYHELYKRDFPLGAGGILSFNFNGNREQISRFIRALKIFSYQVNLGDVRSLIVNSADTTHSEMTKEQLDAAEITPQTIRISAGLENIEDLKADLDNAFKAAFGELGDNL